MLRAAETGNIDAVKRELTGHTDVNSQDEVVFLSLIALCVMEFIAYCLGKMLHRNISSSAYIVFWSWSIELPSCYALCLLYVLFLMSA